MSCLLSRWIHKEVSEVHALNSTDGMSLSIMYLHLHVRRLRSLFWHSNTAGVWASQSDMSQAKISRNCQTPTKWNLLAVMFGSHRSSMYLNLFCVVSTPIIINTSCWCLIILHNTRHKDEIVWAHCQRVNLKSNNSSKINAKSKKASWNTSSANDG